VVYAYDCHDFDSALLVEVDIAEDVVFVHVVQEEGAVVLKDE
jgi:hypothetical protein